VPSILNFLIKGDLRIARQVWLEMRRMLREVRSGVGARTCFRFKRDMAYGDWRDDHGDADGYLNVHLSIRLR